MLLYAVIALQNLILTRGSMSFIPAEIIKKKKLGQANTPEEIRWLIQSFTNGSLPEYQMSAWAMAVYFKGMRPQETAVLTAAMRDSGDHFNFKKLNRPRIDKHSTGGVGDKTTLIIGPILAAAKIHVPMIAGRGLAHTGGTLDKIESLPGFRIQLSMDEFTYLIEKNYFALMGQTENICPADRKFYALRDVTATVDSLPLICGSIMSKKLAEDLTGLVLDVKFGSGAFMKNLDDARSLAELLISTGKENGVQVHALLTNMNQPLGRYVGNSVELLECYEILQNKKALIGDVDFYATTRELSVTLAAHMIFLANGASSIEAARALANDILTSGKALTAFEKWLEYQGPASMSQLPVAKFRQTVHAQSSGFIKNIDCERIGLAGIELGAGRRTTNSKIDHTAGMEFFVRLGQELRKGDPLVEIFSNDKTKFESAESMLQEAFSITSEPPTEILPLIAQVIT